MKQKAKSGAGFTLVEAILVVFLVAVCAMVVSEMFIGQNRIYKVQMAELHVTSDARSAVDDVDDYVRQAHRTLSTYSSYTASNQVLILQLRGVNSSNQILPVYDTVVYYLSGNSLYRQVFPDVTSVRPAIVKKLAATVNGLNFTYDNADYSQVTEITMDLTTQESAGIQTRAITVSSKSTLRNY